MLSSEYHALRRDGGSRLGVLIGSICWGFWGCGGSSFDPYPLLCNYSYCTCFELGTRPIEAHPEWKTGAQVGRPRRWSAGRSMQRARVELGSTHRSMYRRNWFSYATRPTEGATSASRRGIQRTRVNNRRKKWSRARQLRRSSLIPCKFDCSCFT